MKSVKIVMSIFAVYFLGGCDSRENRYDSCLDRAVAQCTPVAAKECGLSNSASDAEFDKCSQYVACEANHIDSCMNP